MSNVNEISVFVRLSGVQLARFEVTATDCEEARMIVIDYLRIEGVKTESAVLALIQGGRA